MGDHHGQDPTGELLERMRKLCEEMDLGPTRRFPEGKISPDDQGEAHIAIGTDSGKVILNFGTPVAWFGLNPGQARIIAAAILERAREIEDIPGGAPAPTG